MTQQAKQPADGYLLTATDKRSTFTYFCKTVEKMDRYRSLLESSGFRVLGEIK